MHIKRRLTGLLACLAAATMLVACGDDAKQISCGPGTEAIDGKCALTDDGCADGTTLADDGTCVPEVVCGAGTEAKDGQCVISEPTSCGANTERDANSGECVVTDQACADGTAYDADSDSCLPTDQVCADGTTWSQDSAMCMPDAQCQPGDVILGGLCATPADELAASADFTEADLHTDGADVALESVGEPFVFAGTIAAPADFDADATIDQDKDVYRFDADAGEWLEIALQSTGLPSPGFRLESADGSYVRYSPFDTDAARQVLLPKTGSYVLTVLPTLVLESGGDIGPVGGDDWSYVGTIEKIGAPSSVAQGDLLTTGLSGEFSTLTDNFFEMTDLPDDGLVHVTFDQLSDDIDAELIVWGEEADAFYNFPISASGEAFVKVPDASSVHMLVDYVRKRGGDDAFDTGVATSLPTKAAGVIGADANNSTEMASLEVGDTLYVTFQAEHGQFIEVSQDNPGAADANLSLYTSDGTRLVEDFLSSADSKQYPSDRALYHYTAGADAYYILEVNLSFGVPLTDIVLTVASETPSDLGELAIGDSETLSGGGMLKGYKDWGFFDLPAKTKLLSGVTVPEGETARLQIYDENFNMLLAMYDGGDHVLPAGSYAVAAVPSSNEITSYDITLSAVLPPMDEAEPNNDIANANPATLGRNIAAVMPAGDVDTFQIDLAQDMASDEVFMFGVEHRFGGGYISRNPYGCKLLDSSGAELISRPVTNRGCALLTSNLSTGTYYVQVSNPSNDRYEYAAVTEIVTGTMLTEPNDTKANATTTTFADLTSGTPYYGELVDDTDPDYLKFEVTTAMASDESLVLRPTTYTTSSGYMDWVIEDDNGTEVARGSLNTRDTKVASADMPPGTYYLKMTWPSPGTGETGAYSFVGAVEASSPGLP